MPTGATCPRGIPGGCGTRKGGLSPVGTKAGFCASTFTTPEFRRQVAKQAKAAVVSGAVDGVMLDWWSDDADRLALVKEIRQAIGDNALILCNANDRTTPQTAPYINGYFMECTESRTRRTLEEDCRYARLGREEPSFASGELRRDVVSQVQKRPEPDAGDHDAGPDAL